MLGKFKTGILSSADLQASPHIYSRRSRLLFAFPLGKGIVSRKAVSSYRSLPHYYENISRLKNGAKSSPSITFPLKTYENYVAA